MKTQTVMLLGSGSDVGKTLLTAAILRLLKRKGLKVAPFKAQNMSSNAFVSAKGYCLSRAQAMQAEAAGVELVPEMNPILLKPNDKKQSELFVLGKSWGVKPIKEYYALKPQLKEIVLQSLEKLKKQYDLIVIEGAGSCVEINLKEFDLVNLGLATSINSPFILVTDIDRGGVFAQAVGCKALFTPEEKKLFKGLIVNKFRGDASMFKTGEKMIEDLTKRPLLGIIPYLENLLIEPEDSLGQDFLFKNPKSNKNLNIAIFDLDFKGDLSDLNSLAIEEDVSLNFFNFSGNSEFIGKAENYDAYMFPPGLALENLLAFYKKNENFIKKLITEKKELWLLGAAYPLIYNKITYNGQTYQALGIIKEDIEIEIYENPKFIENNFLNEDISGYTNFNFISTNKNKNYYENNILAAPFIGLFSRSKFRTAFLNILRKNKNLETKVIAVDTEAQLREKQYEIWANHFEKHFNTKLFLKVINNE